MSMQIFIHEDSDCGDSLCVEAVGRSLVVKDGTGQQWTLSENDWRHLGALAGFSYEVRP